MRPRLRFTQDDARPHDARTRPMIVAVRSYPQGPRVWVAGQRVHHGATGCALVLAACARKRPALCAFVGLALALHDRHDWRTWFARECLPTNSWNGPAGCQTSDISLDTQTLSL
jgi:hypothetical protein